MTRAILSRVVRTSACDSVVQEDCGVPDGTEHSPSTKHPDSPEVFARPNTNLNCARYSVGRDHEVSIATFAEELKANNEDFPTSRSGEGTEHHQCHKTPKRSYEFKHIDHEQVDEKQQAALRAKFKENLAKQNAESKKRPTMREKRAAKEQQNRAESILEHQTEVEVEFYVEEEKAWPRCNWSRQCQSSICRGHKS